MPLSEQGGLVASRTCMCWLRISESPRIWCTFGMFEKRFVLFVFRFARLYYREDELLASLPCAIYYMPALLHLKRFSAAFQLITSQIALKYSALRF
jgi:hypothetical protein